jgi:hypothetical protein
MAIATRYHIGNRAYRHLSVSDEFYRFINSPDCPAEVKALFYDVWNGAVSPAKLSSMLVMESRNLDPHVEVNFIDIRKGGDALISYLPSSKGKEEDWGIDGGPWGSSKRQQLRPSRLFGALFTEPTLRTYGITDPVKEEFANYAKKYVKVELNLEEVSGADIAKYYDVKNYARPNDTVSNLGKSCMRYSTLIAAGVLELYTKLPNLSMLVAFDSKHKVLARALIWRGITTGSGYSPTGHKQIQQEITLLDRIYSTDDFYVNIFTDYAKERGWWYKQRQSADAKKLLVNPAGEQVTVDLSVPTGLKKKLQLYPYTDTFSYMSEDYTMLGNGAHDDTFCYTLTGQQGGIGGQPRLRPAARAAVAGAAPQDGYAMTDLHGSIRANEVVTCAICHKTGHLHLMNAMTHWPKSMKNQPAARVCATCLEENWVFGEYSGAWVPIDQAALVLSPYGADDFALRDTAIYSKRYQRPVITNYAMHLPIYNDYFYEGVSPMQHSDYHGHNILAEDAVLVEWAGSRVYGSKAYASSFVHKDFVEPAKLLARRRKKEMYDQMLSMAESYKGRASDGGILPGTLMLCKRNRSEGELVIVVNSTPATTTSSGMAVSYLDSNGRFAGPLDSQWFMEVDDSWTGETSTPSLPVKIRRRIFRAVEES